MPRTGPSFGAPKDASRPGPLGSLIGFHSKSDLITKGDLKCDFSGTGVIPISKVIRFETAHNFFPHAIVNIYETGEVFCSLE